MKKSIQLNRSERGFTLLEVIITIVIAAILGTLLVTFMGTSITKSAIPVNQTRVLGISIGKIETITAAYESYLKASAEDKGTAWTYFLGVCTINEVTPTSITLSTTIPDSVVAFQIIVSEGDQKLASYFTQ